MSEANPTEVIRGKVESVVYHNEDNGYTVFEISDDNDNLITAVGNISLVNEGECVTLSGSWVYHKEFGKQFAFTSFEKRLPVEVEGILQYLSSRTIKGVGPVTALKIVNKYGTDTFDVIENHPEWLADIPGITHKKAAQISESFKQQTEIRDAMLFFGEFLGTGEITKVYKKLGSGVVGIVKNNPYILCEGNGVSFEKADSIAASLGFPKDSSERVISGIRYIFDYNAITNGHTCLPKDKLISAVSELLEIDEPSSLDRIDDLLDLGDLKQYNDGGSLLIMTKETDESESYIAKRLHELSGEITTFNSADVSSFIQSVEAGLGISYAELQREALFRVMRRGATVITGGPGTGKTTVIKAILAIFNKIGLKTVLCAPTGRAAKRMSEATSHEAKTIHRMLEMERSSNDEIKFNRNSRSPLDEKVVIVDEASMIDLSLMDALMRALPRGARLVLLGDSDQLPSVGAGNVLADIISSGAVDTVCLTEIFRQSGESLIVTNAHKINKGEMPILNITDNDFFFVRRDRETDIAEAVATLITERLPRAYGDSIRERIQVITPSKKGTGGVEVLNKILQEKINPPLKFKKEYMAHGTIFREGDRVMQTVNNYEIEWERGAECGIGIFNGDVGVIENIYTEERFLDIRFDDRLVKYSFDNLDELELSYAITVHKSQGSEYPVVIVPMYSCPPMLMTRNLLYTAVTRAKSKVLLVGRADIVRRMVDNKREVLRYTTLVGRLCKQF